RWHSTIRGECQFQPRGDLHAVGEEIQANGRLWSSGKGGTLAARLFVGLNVGGKKKWKIQDVINVTRRIRQAQGHSPNASFVAQKGVYQSFGGTKVVEE